jgi:putative aldouronate transport system substrate-binding protein
MKKRMMLFLSLALIIGAIFTGCASKDKTKETTNEETNKVTNAATNEGSESNTSKEEVVTLKWIAVGSGMPSNYAEWLANINPYLEEKIGVNIDVEIVSWGDWGNRRNVLVNSGEYFDILFTDSGNYTNDVLLGAYYDIKDLVKTSAPELYEYIPEDYWKAVTVNDGVYSVPTYKDSSLSNYIVWDEAMVEKYSIDIEKLTTLESLTDALMTIKEGEGSASFPMDRAGLSIITSLYDSMGAELAPVGVKYNDETRTVVNLLEQEDIQSQLETIHKWYKAGIINADAPTIDSSPTYKAVSIAQGWPSAAKTTWGPNMGVEATAVQINETIVSNATVRGSLNAIYSGTKYPEKCLEFLQLINLDSYVRDSFYYGLEGDNFKYTQENKIEKLNTEWPMAGYTQGTFFTISQLADTETNQWDEVKVLNEAATPSVLLGFTMDVTSVQNEIANCREVYSKYISELLTGCKDPAILVPQITKELKAAGMDKIIEEAQKQIDAQYK